jgi:hypothetical protein
VVPPTTPPTAEAVEKDDAGPEPSSLDLRELTRVWPAVLDRLHQTAPALAASFDGARPVGVDAAERTVTIGFPADHTFNKRKAEGKDKREQLSAALEAVIGQKLVPAYDVLEDEGGEEPVASEEPKPDVDTPRWWRD